ncbi:MAG: PQQ-binding-like beta-propeller repeat protein [Verrucomicrobiae bacterium]|nr:PQQ-binding-like beta-propeller repeat protein [Verrucomicrobiae bacterium]
MTVALGHHRFDLSAWKLAALAAALLPSLANATGGATADRVIGSPEPGWPQWRGIWRDGVSRETGLLPAWPEGGPPRLWTVSGLGRGWSSPIITHGSIYITGDVGGSLVIFAFDLDGRPLWQAQNGGCWTTNYPGARSSCTYHRGRIYHMNAHGRVVCLDAATGRERWAVNVLEQFEGSNITWGLSECLLVDGSRVFVGAGGKKGQMVALDTETGRTVWASSSIEGDRAGYASPLLFEWGGLRHLVSGSSRHAYGVCADTGRLLWTFHQPTKHEILAATPVYLGEGRVAVLRAASPACTLLSLSIAGADVCVREVWTARLGNYHGGVVLYGGRLYGSGFHKPAQAAGWGCADAHTGEILYTTRELPRGGSCIWADGRVYALAENGVMALLKPTPGGFEVAGRFTLVEARNNDAWAHPVLLDGRLYLRYHDTLYCYDVRRK